MGLRVLKGRLGKHRFHPMLVHFPSGLYPFGLVMDCIGFYTGDPVFYYAGWYAMVAALSTSLLAITYGAVDFLQLKDRVVWNKAFYHAALNGLWFITFLVLAFLRYKYSIGSITGIHLLVEGVCVVGLFYSNYLGADLVVRHRVGIDEDLQTPGT
jgi:uncharacterized membrane protein